MVCKERISSHPVCRHGFELLYNSLWLLKWAKGGHSGKKNSRGYITEETEETIETFRDMGGCGNWRERQSRIVLIAKERELSWNVVCGYENQEKLEYKKIPIQFFKKLMKIIRRKRTKPEALVFYWLRRRCLLTSPLILNPRMSEPGAMSPKGLLLNPTCEAL